MGVAGSFPRLMWVDGEAGTDPHTQRDGSGGGTALARLKGRAPLPRNMSLNWFMPAPVKRREGSFVGTSESEGWRVHPLSSK